MPQLRGNEPILGLKNVEVNFLRVKVMVYFEATGILDDNRGKALQGSHNDHSKSMTSGEECSFKAPPKMIFHYTYHPCATEQHDNKPRTNQPYKWPRANL